ncbi:MAG: Prefoldin subunit alpha [archaeon GW2011_AR13]|nr:MAG: Prefoldin subunit alpha [archaeon GW2011_AR13]HIG95152.1 prefoldin subunit alpha [Nanoarchaeota archaeon]HIH63392.1 prefoldin subunit alpha [Nanoarchaeota archaeon]HIJ09845.1 prefoldin subunit alpha [Nanoarchaeota archaeon]
MEQDQQELMFRFQMFEQQIQQLGQQLDAVEQGIIEMTSLNIGLNDLVGGKNKEIMAPVGRGIFAQAKLLSDELLVDIGEGKLVKKSIPDTQKLIEEQVQKLGQAKIELNNAMEQINEELTKTMIEAQKKSKE